MDSSDQPPWEDREESGEEVRSIVARCIEAFEAGEQDAVTRLCAGRPSLERAVRARLEKLNDLQLLDTPRVSTTPFSIAADPEAIGPYRIVREIGRGGMGQVFLAHQTSPVERDVALKLVGRGLDSEAIVARFRAEQQTLARMGHASIAQVHDAGTAPDGRPFFVMEYVDGVPFNQFTAEGSRDDGLELFVDVCAAVQHAHDRGVIHRDLKPSNVLVTADGTPKVIDFGIAKALDAGEDTPPITRHDEILGTPEYMSPEQARSGQLDVDVRSDVYSLGVMLYELVAGELPFPARVLRAAGIREMERIIAETTPVAPSVRRRETDRGGTARGASRELDWIVLKALEKEPDLRYPSVRALSADVERFLADAPVEAGPPSVWYRVRKLARRHRLVVTAAAALLVTTGVGIAVSQHFASLAGDRAKETDVVRGDLGASIVVALEVLEDSLRRAAEQSGLDEVPPELVLETQRVVGSLGEDADLPMAARPRLASSLARVSMLYSELGRPIEARAAAERALQIDAGLQPRSDAARASRLRVRGMARSSLAHALEDAGDTAGARDAFAAAVADLREARTIEDDADTRHALERGLVNVAQSLAVEDPEGALEAMNEALELGATDASSPSRIVDTAMHRSRYGQLLLERGDLEGAERELVAAADDLESHLFVPKARRACTYALDYLSRVYTRTGRHADAVRTLERCVDLERSLVAMREDSPARRYELATALVNLGGARMEIPDVAGAIEAQEEAVELLDLVVEQAPTNVEYRTDHARALYNMGLCLYSRGAPGDGDRAVELIGRTVEVSREVCDLAPDDPQARFFLATSTLGYAAAVFGAGDQEGGLMLLDEGIETLHEMLDATPSWVAARHRLAEAMKNRIAMMVGMGQMMETTELAQDGVDAVNAGLELSPDDHRLLTLRVEFRAHVAALDLGRTEDAAAACDAAEAWVDEWPEGVPAHLEAAGLIAICADGTEDEDTREGLFAQALDHVAAALELGFEPPPGWPEPGGGCYHLAGRQDFEDLVGEN